MAPPSGKSWIRLHIQLKLLSDAAIAVCNLTVSNCPVVVDGFVCVGVRGGGMCGGRGRAHNHGHIFHLRIKLGINCNNLDKINFQNKQFIFYIFSHLFCSQTVLGLQGQFRLKVNFFVEFILHFAKQQYNKKALE